MIRTLSVKSLFPEMLVGARKGVEKRINGSRKVLTQVPTNLETQPASPARGGRLLFRIKEIEGHPHPADNARVQGGGVAPGFGGAGEAGIGTLLWSDPGADVHGVNDQMKILTIKLK